MQIFEYKGKRFEVPESWDEVDVKTFLSIYKEEEGSVEDEDLGELEGTVKVLSKITGISLADIREISIKELVNITGKLGFLYTPITEEFEDGVYLEGNRLFKIQDLATMKYKQYIDVESYMKEGDNPDSFVNVFCGLLVEEFGEYKLSEFEWKKSKVLDLPITKVLPYLNHFYSKKKTLQRTTQTCSQKLQYLETIVKNITTTLSTMGK